MPEQPTPWHTDQWFTSPWNHDADVTADVRIPEDIEFHDVTLRDGEQQAGIVFNASDKMRIAEGLADAGVQRIEAGLPAVSAEDEKALRMIASAGLPSKVYAFSRCMADDVKLAADCGVDGVILEVPSSRHLIELGYRWSVERAIELSTEATGLAHDHGLDVSFFPIDATRAGLEEYLNLVERVATDGHMDALVLVDTFGVLAPQAVSKFVEFSKARFDVPLETHFHMDYGLGVANTLIAAACGARTLQTTVAGVGERAGNVPMEETALALKTLYGVDPGIDTTKLTALSRLVCDLAGVEQPPNRPVTGPQLFDVESGIIATWVRNVRDVDLTECVPYDPRMVGQDPPRIVLGKGSGVDNITDHLEQHGLTVTAEQQAELLQQVKSASLAKKGLLTKEEFAELARSVIGDS
ncbi:MAG: pyruvate carboxyltransferase [Propionibacteriales bacterium]|nr:pyruvate carboxyltransferase [Propionibacteriales bacterium]